MYGIDSDESKAGLKTPLWFVLKLRWIVRCTMENSNGLCLFLTLPTSINVTNYLRWCPSEKKFVPALFKETITNYIWISGAHYPESPSSLYCWVNPFPYHFIFSIKYILTLTVTALIYSLNRILFYTPTADFKHFMNASKHLSITPPHHPNGSHETYYYNQQLAINTRKFYILFGMFLIEA